MLVLLLYNDGNPVGQELGVRTLFLSIAATSLILSAPLDARADDPSRPEFEWSQKLGGQYEDWIRVLSVDGEGSIYSWANMGDSVDADPGPGTTMIGPGRTIVKSDGDGNFLGTRTSVESVWRMLIGPNGTDVIIVGSFTGTDDFDPGAGTVNMTAGPEGSWYVQALDKDGDLLWATAAESTEPLALADDGALDAAGNIYIAGHFMGTVDFDPGVGVVDLTSRPGNPDGFILKLDPDGDFVWAHRINMIHPDPVNRIAVGTDGTIAVVGQFTATPDFDPGAGVVNMTSNGNPDAFALSLDTDGDFRWARAWGGTNHDVAEFVGIDDGGNVYVASAIRGTVDIDPGAGVNTQATTSPYYKEAFLKLNSSGATVWTKAIAFGSFADFENMCVNGPGNIYATGQFDGTVDFDGGPSLYNATGSFDAYLLKINRNGTFAYVYTLDGSPNQEGMAVVIDADDNVYFSGGFEGTADFNSDPDQYELTSAGNADGFVVKVYSRALPLRWLPLLLVMGTGIGYFIFRSTRRSRISERRI